MAFEGEFHLVREDGVVRIKKHDFDFEKDLGAPILGWFSDKFRAVWFNHLNEVGNVVPVEERDYNPDHITLYSRGEIVGWIERDFRDEIKQALLNYLMAWTAELETLEPEPEQEVVEVQEPVERLQLSLF